MAVPVIAVVQELPLAYTLTVGALALTLSFKVLVQKTVSGPMRYGAMIAFVAATLPPPHGRKANGFLGVGGRSRGGRDVGIRAIDAVLATKPGCHAASLISLGTNSLYIRHEEGIGNTADPFFSFFRIFRF